MTILDKLADYAFERVKAAEKSVSLDEIRHLASAMPKGNFEFEKALKKDEIAFICECKKASPSKGVIAEEFPYLQIAKEYEAAGADCISVLTEPKWFMGNDSYLREIAENVNIPCLRKDLTSVVNTLSLICLYSLSAKGFDRKRLSVVRGKAAWCRCGASDMLYTIRNAD